MHGAPLPSRLHKAQETQPHFMRSGWVAACIPSSRTHGNCRFSVADCLFCLALSARLTMCACAALPKTHTKWALQALTPILIHVIF